MSHPHPIATSSSNFQPIFDNALKAYERRTKRVHPLNGKLQACGSPGSVLVVFQLQIQKFSRYQSTIDPLDRIVFLLRSVCILRRVLKRAICIPTTPRINRVRPDLDALNEISEIIEDFLRRLEIYSEVSLNQELVDTIMDIMVEALCVLAIVTKEINHDRMKKRLNKLRGRSNIEDALENLNKLTQGEARMATAQALRVTHTFDDRVRRITDKVIGVDDTVASVGDRVASVDDNLRGVMDNVFGVDDTVAGFDDTVASVDDRAEGHGRRSRGR